MTAKTNTTPLSFNPETQTKILLKALENERTLDVLMRRYGLKGEPETLESVGSSYGITRERVRQIEAQAIKAIRKSQEYSKIASNLKELANVIEKYGEVIPEYELIKLLNCTDKAKRHILFLLDAGEYFSKKKENPEFYTHWYLDEARAHSVREGLRSLARELSIDITLPEEEIIEKYIQKIPHPELIKKANNKETPIRWLKISKKIARNPLGEWGLAHSPAVRVKGIRDYAYLTLKRHGSPMHFSEVATQIEELFGRKANPATTHNELIKDPRFVLVGRGLYALTEWGYTQGPVREIIKSILKKEGPLSKQEIIERVKRERYVKDNTIAVNLQDINIFERLDDGRFTLK